MGASVEACPEVGTLVAVIDGIAVLAALGSVAGPGIVSCIVVRSSDILPDGRMV